MAQPWAEAEMAAAAVWDRRCVRSLVAICERRFDRPRVSFSKACGAAVRQAAHRICSHAKTTVDGLLRGHFQQTAVRAGNWKAIQPGKNKSWELYDLSKDISEEHNVAGEQADVLARIKSIAQQAHQPAVEGTFQDTVLHERDRAAKWGDTQPQ